MKKLTKVVAGVLFAVMATLTLAACSEPSADQAYDNYRKGTYVKMNEAGEKYAAEAPGVQDDKEAAKKLAQTYIDALRPAVAELEKVDMGKLTGDRKETAPLELQTMKGQLEQLEAAMANAND